MTTGIYKINNKINGKCYIGQSVNIERRWKDHKIRYNLASADSERNYLYRAMTKDGIENFMFDILEECFAHELNDKEKYWIAITNSTNNACGYNLTYGGSNASVSQKLTLENVEEISNLLRENALSNFEIADIYKISHVTVSGINTGYRWKRDWVDYPIRKPKKRFCEDCGREIYRDSIKCEECHSKSQRRVDRPTKDELVRLITASGFTQVGRIYGVSANAIIRWCKSYGIPHTKKELKELGS